MKTRVYSIAASGVLLALATSGSALALDQQVIDEAPGGSTGGSTTYKACTDYYDYVEGLPPQLPAVQIPGHVYCVKGAPASTFGAQADVYAHEPDSYGNEAASANLCHSPGVTECRIVVGSRGVPRQVCTTTAPAALTPDAWEVGWRKSKVLGNDNFGAGVFLTAVIGAIPGVPAYAGPDDVMVPAVGDKMYAEASLRAPVTVFGHSADVVHVLAETDAEYGKAANAHTLVIIGGIILHEQTSHQSLAVTKTWQRDLLSANATFMFGPVPASMSAKLRGGIGFTGNVGPKVTVAGTGVAADTTPWLNVTGTASLAIGAPGLEAGIEGQLELIDVSVPSKGSLIMDSSGTISWGLDSELTLRTLSGSLSAYVEVLNKRWRRTLVNFQGYSATTPLFKLGNCQAILGN
jgi:hypothetical protein